jgi:hypothetical protein
MYYLTGDAAQRGIERGRRHPRQSAADTTGAGGATGSSAEQVPDGGRPGPRRCRCHCHLRTGAGSCVRKLGNDAIVLQDRKVYREAFNLHARGKDLADPEKRRSIVAFVRAVAEASQALKKDPKPYLPHISSVIGFSLEEISFGWPETEFPVEIIPDMLDVLVTEEAWVAK